jgi:hypothetical protein
LPIPSLKENIMTAKKNPPKTGSSTAANNDAGMALQETRAVKDLAIGDIVQVDGLENDQVVRKAKRIRKGLDAGLLHVTLVALDGDIERIALAPEDRVVFVGKAPEAGKGKNGRKGKVKEKAKAKGRPEPDAVVAPTPQAAETPAPRTEPKTSKTSRGLQKAKGEKKMSCLDAAAKLLTETGQPMSCQQLIEAIAAKGYWTSPAGKTPSATLYAAIVREIRTKKDHARFRKTVPGRFALA